MPVLGSTASSAATSKAGVYIPAGWGATVKAALAAAKTGTGLAEIVGIGDSTTYGAGNPSWYSWLQRVYDRLHTSSGIPDGGCGYVHPNDWTFGTYPALTHDGTYPSAVYTGFGGAANITGGWLSNSGNGTDNVQITAPGTRIRVYLGRTPTSGKAAYSVDGGAETTVDLLIPVGEPGAGQSPYDILPPTLITGLASSGTHTLKVRSAGKSSIRQPIYSTTATGVGRVTNPQLQPGGSLTQGQSYDYQVTVTSANGESAPVSLPSSFTPTSTNKTLYVQVIADYGYTGINLYRRNTGGGAYGLVKNAATGVAGATAAITDDGTVTPTTAPPSSSTLGTFASGNDVNFFADFLNDSGVVIHRYAFNGASTTTFFDSVNGSAQTIATTPPALGLPTMLNASSNANATTWGVNKGANPQYRNPCLVMIQLGTNNFGASTDPIADGTLHTYLEDLHGLIRTAYAAGAEVCLVQSPTNVWVANGAQKASGVAKQATRALAESVGAAWIDFGTALGPVNTWSGKGYAPTALGGPHLNVASYQAEADFLYTNLLAPLL